LALVYVSKNNQWAFESFRKAADFTLLEWLARYEI
jgi:hypothetical protein